MVLRKQGAHSQPINKVKTLDEYLVATGDDNGCIKVQKFKRFTPLTLFCNLDLGY